MNDLLSKEFAALYVAAVWVVFWSIVLYSFRRYLLALVDALVGRIQRGSSVTIGPVSIGEPPKELKESGVGGVAVSDPSKSAAVPPGPAVHQLDAEYRRIVEDGYFLLHAAEVIRERTSPRSGRYRVRIWLESYHDERLENVVSVTYRVWDDFARPVIGTASRATNFDLWVSIYGEFPVLAYIERKNGTGALVGRYIDLPGRPPD